MPISPDFTSVFSQDWKINFLQCAPNGFLKHTDLCNIFQLTAAEHAELGGISHQDMQEFDQAWVMSRLRVEIDQLPKWKDTVTIKTWIVNLEKSRSVRALEMYLNGKKIAGAEAFWVVMNTQKRRPDIFALPHEHFEKFPENRGTLEGVKKITFPETSPISHKRTVRFSDLDIVNHMNSAKYLEWCIDVMSPEKIMEQNIHTFDMNFTRELLWGNEAEILEFTSENGTFFSVVKDGISCFALELN